MSDSPITTTSSDPAIQAAVARINQYGPYGYQPTLLGSLIFTIVWGLLFSILTFQGIKGRRWWLLATLSFGSLLEFAGNAIRIYSHFNSQIVNAYIAQQVILVLTPAFFAAAHFTILVKICNLFDSRYILPLKPKWLISIFVTIDVASLAIQGGGSGTAAIAEQDDVSSVETVNKYGQVVTVGLAIQLIGYICFNIIFLLFIYRVRKQSNQDKIWNKQMKIFLLATWISSLFVLGRSCFRTAEMAKGWIGQVATIEWYYLVFDATFVALAVIILIFSPVKYLPREEDGQFDLPRTSNDLERSNPTTPTTEKSLSPFL